VVMLPPEFFAAAVPGLFLPQRVFAAPAAYRGENGWHAARRSSALARDRRLFFGSVSRGRSTAGTSRGDRHSDVSVLAMRAGRHPSDARQDAAGARSRPRHVGGGICGQRSVNWPFAYGPMAASSTVGGYVGSAYRKAFRQARGGGDLVGSGFGGGVFLPPTGG